MKKSLLFTSLILLFAMLHAQENTTKQGQPNYSSSKAILDTFPCQPFQLVVNSSVAANNNTINLCGGNAVQFTANGIYSNNNINYHQSDSNSICSWYVNNHLVNTGLLYNLTSISGTHAVVRIVLTDTNNCSMEKSFVISSQDYQHLVLAPANLSTYWLGQNISLVADSSIEIITSAVVSDPTPMALPDGGCANPPPCSAYEKIISVNNALQGSTIQSATDLQSVCLNIEHSYLGDLTIHLLCPNGQFLDIFTSPNGFGATWLGIPVDNDTQPTATGIGWTYCWTPQATVPFPNVFGASAPAGDYQPTAPFTSLIGCPINGNWTIRVEDHLSSDNGFIFQVDLTFDTSVVAPDIFDTVRNCSWTGTDISSSTNTTAIAQPTTTGNYTYSFSATNSCGDTLVQFVTVNVIDTPAFVSGRVFIDANQNCLFNSGDVKQINRIVEFSPGGYYASTDSNGIYSAAIPAGNYTVSLAPSAYLSTLCPTQHTYSVEALRGVTLSGINFGDTLLPFSDMEVFLGASIAVLGDSVSFDMMISNHGNTPNSGILHLKTDSTFAYVSCSSAGSCALTGNGKVTFNYPTIAPGSTLLLSATFQIPVNTDIIGDVFKSEAWFDTIPTDINLANNIDSTLSLIHAAYDPNLKTVMPMGEGPSGDIYPTDSVLKYTIHFQNTGNWPATNIIVTDTLSAFVDPATIEPGTSSHPYIFHLNGQGIVEFRFMNIFLPDSASNESGSNGYVCYRIKQRNNAPGTQITNTANIFFDYNPLIATNVALNTIAWPLQTPAVTESKAQHSFVHPNPVVNNLHVRFANNDSENVVEISSVTGAFIASYRFTNETNADISMKNFKNGVYIIRVISKNSIDVSRVVKM